MCIFAKEQRLERFWKIQDSYSSQFVLLDIFLINFRVYYDNIHRYSFRYRSFHGRNTHNIVSGSLFLYICILVFIFCLQFILIPMNNLGNFMLALLVQNSHQEVSQKDLLIDNFNKPLFRCLQGCRVKVPFE